MRDRLPIDIHILRLSSHKYGMVAGKAVSGE